MRIYGKRKSKEALQERDQRIVTLYMQGSTVQQLMERFNLSNTHVLKILHLAGCAIRVYRSLGYDPPSQWARSYGTRPK